MEQTPSENTRPNPPRRRRKRSKWQDFKEAYLPVIIVAVALVMIISFIIGSVSRANDGKTKDTEPATNATEDQTAALQAQAESLMAEADRLANMLDYEGAVAVLSSFSDMTAVEGMVEKYNEYSTAHAALVPYTDVEHVAHLSFNVLIADLQRALNDPNYGSQFNRNYVTTEEFKAILQQAYDKGYILVSPYDLAEKSVAGDGSVAMTAGKLFLPEGKKPLVLTQYGGNFFTYMVDGDGDGIADKDGSGFPSRLVLDAAGKLTCEYVDSDGTTLTGSYDFITILNDFVEAHPDFSYRGARATIAFTGYDGILGYRTDAETAGKMGADFHADQLSGAQSVLAKLKEDGYVFACYTYDMANYGEMSAASIQADLDLWNAEVVPLLGNVDILVYPYGGDIADNDRTYSGDKYQLLRDNGFCYFIGQDSATRSWGQVTDSYFRQTRRNVTGALMTYSYSYYEDLFDAPGLLDPNRGEVPN